MNRRSLIRTLVGASIAVTTAARLSLDPVTPEPPFPGPVSTLTNEQLNYIYDALMGHAVPLGTLYVTEERAGELLKDFGTLGT